MQKKKRVRNGKLTESDSLFIWVFSWLPKSLLNLKKKKKEKKKNIKNLLEKIIINSPEYLFRTQKMSRLYLFHLNLFQRDPEFSTFSSEIKLDKKNKKKKKTFVPKKQNW